jgi:hypothetical protein
VALSCLSILNLHRLQRCVPEHPPNLRVIDDLDVVECLNAINEVAGHALADIPTPQQHQYTACVRRKE